MKFNYQLTTVTKVFTHPIECTSFCEGILFLPFTNTIVRYVYY